jgi:crotonobetainyl-CoA:carnitine CoA-transferase CaiB-like acyl-CoA transferase
MSIITHTGIKVLDLTRVIAGPCISRTLAEYGANVLKITSPKLPDVPYYQLDLNFGKKTAELDFNDTEDRKIFESLLEDVDVIVDGYRTGSLERQGYGPKGLLQKLKGRGKGFVYVAENCFGFTGPWKERSGWQPIADAVSGLAWGQGLALGLNEPVLPPYPLSDYGTGEVGAIAALNGLLHRAISGGSYFTSVSLTRYNLWVQSLGQYPSEVWKHMLSVHSEDEEFRKLRHLANFDVVSKVRNLSKLLERKDCIDFG